ncbi:MAG: NAD(P)/FAD-dependent oxidoreductase [Gammaproteobacteria bacterium]|nr:NAD(P)/FAD-dependent oxidoreductase [Gammaproteobacteria bacterium]
MLNVKLLIVGGGPAGLAAAVSAYDKGERDILILERENKLGGILNQCIHNGFGLHTFNEELTGPEYAQRFIDQVKDRNIKFMLNTTVIEVTEDKVVKALSEEGLLIIKAEAIILSCGCRERPRGAINIAGSRGAGVYSAGTAQKLVNIDGLMPGKEVVILGSGDIGLIMARRMTFEGAKVKAVVELMPYSSGLNRNIVQCLNDFNIPLLFSHTVVEIKGDNRVESVIIAEVDERLNPKMETAQEIKCDTLLLSVGLLPENELARGAKVGISRITRGAVVDDRLMTNVDGIFECGNVLHVHDLVDFVSLEAKEAGAKAVDYINNGNKNEKFESVEIKTDGGVRYVVPELILKNDNFDPLTLKLRVGNVYKKVRLEVACDGEVVYSRAKQVVAPGEMQTIDLKSADVEKLRKANEIKVYLRSM